MKQSPRKKEKFYVYFFYFIFAIPLLLACWIDMLFCPIKHLLIWRGDSLRCYHVTKWWGKRLLNDGSVDSYQFKPYNRFLGRFWDLF